MRHLPSRRSLSTALIISLAVGSTANAHDDDYRKLLSQQPPVFGPIWTANDDTQARGLFDMQNMTLLANIPLNNFPGVNVTSGNDCWGYVSPSGREYAIMGVEGGFGFVEITDPINPVVIDTVTGPVSLWHDVKVVGQYAYGVSEGGSGIQVMDLSDIDNGNVTLVRNWTGGGYNTTHNIITNEETGSLWLAGANIGNGGLINIDLSNPALPSIDGGWTDMYVHDAQVVTWHDGPLAGRELAFLASGFSGGFSETGLRIADVTDPNNTVTLATIFYPSAGYSHQCWLSTDRSILYLNDELDEGNSVSVTTTRVFNVEDPTNPVFLGTYTTGKAAIDHNLYTRDHVIYQSNYRSGLRVFDGLDPVNPTEIAYFDSYPGSDAAEFNGAWSNYPFMPSGTIIVSDIERGLFLLRLDAELDSFALQQRDDQPETVSPDGGDPISVNIITRDGASFESIHMFVDTDGTGFTPVFMNPNPDGSATAMTPAIECGQTLQYFFRVTDNEGLVKTLPANAPSSVYTASVASSFTEVFADNFETNTGWSVSGSVDDGAWERGIPAGGGGRGDPATDSDGSGRCYLTDNVAGNSDVDGGTTTLTSPAMDATGEGTPTLSYDLWYSNNIGEVDDTIFIDISNNNGGSWQALDSIGPGDPAAGGGWNTYSFDLSQIFTNPSNQVRIRFRAGDTGAGSVVEAAVDAVSIELVSCENSTNPCPADITGDGNLNFLDVSAFLAAFGNQEPLADFQQDGNFNFLDVSAFLAAFGNGCP
ncbi:MAG: choice-of-anchor B family protein [Phycisphaerales bacterium]|nr:choice-of-anchor B family protein [Phycisphaerales bacterium]